MDEAVKMSSRLFYLLSHLILAIDIKNICNKVQGVGIVLNFGVETSEVKPVGKVLLIDVAKVLVAS